MEAAKEGDGSKGPDIGIINKDLILDRKSEEIPATPKD